MCLKQVVGKGEYADEVQFRNIYLVNMESRSDKLDAFRLTASLTGFNFEVQPAIDGATVSNRSLSAVSGDYPDINR